RGPGLLCDARRPLEGHRHAPRHRSCRPRHGAGDAVTVIVLAKSPVPGRVKTRLCPPCDPEQAAQLAEAALIDTLTAVAATPCRRRVLALDGPLGSWVPAGFEVLPQHDDGLAERLAHAFTDVDEGGLLIGMDTPQVTPTRLDGALRTLMT